MRLGRFFFVRGFCFVGFCLVSGCFCLRACLCTMFVPSWGRGRKMASDPLELKLQMFVSHRVDSGSGTWAMAGAEHYVLSVNHLSRPPIFWDQIPHFLLEFASSARLADQK